MKKAAAKKRVLICFETVAIILPGFYFSFLSFSYLEFELTTDILLLNYAYLLFLLLLYISPPNGVFSSFDQPLFLPFSINST